MPRKKLKSKNGKKDYLVTLHIVKNLFQFYIIDGRVEWRKLKEIISSLWIPIILHYTDWRHKYPTIIKLFQESSPLGLLSILVMDSANQNNLRKQGGRIYISINPILRWMKMASSRLALATNILNFRTVWAVQSNAESKQQQQLQTSIYNQYKII